LPEGKKEEYIAKSKVVLVGFESEQERYEAIKKMAELLGMSFEEADEMANMAPVDILVSIPEEAAGNLAEKLSVAGAVVEVLPWTKSSRFCAFHPHRSARARCRTCGEYICDLCLINSKGKLFCPEHFEIFKQKQVLKVIGGIFIAVLAIFLTMILWNPVKRLVNLYGPVGELKVAAVFVSEHPNKQKSALFSQQRQGPKAEGLVSGEDHTVSDVAVWFNREYTTHTGRDESILRIDPFGFYEIQISPPTPPQPGDLSYAALKKKLQYRSWFKKFKSENNLDEQLKKYDIIVVVDLVETTGVSMDYMEEIGSSSGSYAYLKFPVITRAWANDYYLAALAHYISRSMGAKVKQTEKGYPKKPEGLADPRQVPTYPQRAAEIMACYLPVHAFTIERPGNLIEYAIGPFTAYEFGWISKTGIAGLR